MVGRWQLAYWSPSLSWVAALQTMMRMHECQSSGRGIESRDKRRYAGCASMRKPLPLASQLERGCSNETFLQQYRTEHRKVIDGEAAHQIEKLNRLLKRYDPDLVELHWSIEKAPRKIEYTCSMNLRLPTGNLHASGTGA